MRAYKGFNTDMTCRGYQFEIGRKEVEDEANCARNGFHCAENPLDCLTYYPDINNSVYCLVEAEGDIDEDGNNSKISCTELTPIFKMTPQHLLYDAILYMIKYKDRPIHSLVISDSGIASGREFAIVRGAHPTVVAEGGNIVALIQTHPDKPSLVIDACVKAIPKGRKEGIFTILNHQIVEVVK